MEKLRATNGPVTKLPEIPNKKRHRYSYSGALNLQFLRETKEKAQKRRTALPNLTNASNDNRCCLKSVKKRPKPTVEAPPPQVANTQLYPPHAHGQKPLKKFKAMARMVKNQLASMDQRDGPVCRGTYEDPYPKSHRQASC